LNQGDSFAIGNSLGEEEGKRLENKEMTFEAQTVCALDKRKYKWTLVHWHGLLALICLSNHVYSHS
jgi:hypothetical protein